MSLRHHLQQFAGLCLGHNVSCTAALFVLEEQCAAILVFVTKGVNGQSRCLQTAKQARFSCIVSITPTQIWK